MSFGCNFSSKAKYFAAKLKVMIKALISFVTLEFEGGVGERKDRKEQVRKGEELKEEGEKDGVGAAAWAGGRGGMIVRGVETVAE